MNTRPWSPADRLAWAVSVAVGAVLCAISWWGASGEARFDDQVGWATLALTGLLVASAAQVGWLLRGRRAVGDRRSRLIVATTAGSIEFEAIAVPRPTAPLVVCGPAQRRYHRPGCPLAAGRNWPAADRASLEPAGKAPCGVCRP